MTSQPPLRPDDAALLEAIREEGLALDQPQEVTHSLGFIHNRTGAMAAFDELQQRGWPEVIPDEEVDGDDLWHVAAFGSQMLDPQTVAATRVEMEELARRLGGQYDGWDLAVPVRVRRFRRTGNVDDLKR